ncbi:MAG: hypothetical protein WC279_13515 [Sulfurimonas sp.]|jgi:hypothetical protein|uniref:hypothetical protein n=1 Tax=Sulfurimonas sp. TaxID=2022749 RepID=UPI00356B51DC
MADYKVFKFETVTKNAEDSLEAQRLHETLKFTIAEYPDIQVNTTTLYGPKQSMVRYITTVSDIPDTETHKLISELVKSSLELGFVY